MIYKLRNIPSVFITMAAIALNSSLEGEEIKMPEPALKISFEENPDGDSKAGRIKNEAKNVDYVNGKFGKAARFATQKHSNVKIDGKIIDQDQGCIAAWVRLNHPSSRNYDRTMLNIGGPTKHLNGVNFMFCENSLLSPLMRVKDLNWDGGKWHHVAYAWKPNNSSKAFPFRYDVAVYIDGKGAAMRTVNRRPIPAKTITLGAYPVPEYGRPQLLELEGDIDDFRVYTQCLSPSQIAVLAGIPEEKALRAFAPPKEKAHSIVNLSGRKNSFLKEKGKGDVLIGEGHPVEIIISKKAGKNDKIAAKELQEYISLMTGMKIPVKNTVDNKNAVNIFTGAMAAKEAGIQIPKHFNDDEIYLKTKGNFCVLAGGGDSGAMNAAYALLEYFGVRWYSAGKDGEFVPSKTLLKIPIGEWRYTPFFQMRRIQLCGPYDYNKNISHKDLQEWGRRNKLQTGRYSAFHRMVAPHLAKIIPEKEFHEHPEYFGMGDDGKRAVPSKNNLNPCTSNPEVIKKIQEKAIQMLKANPKAKYFCIEPIDGGGWCLCKNCRELDIDLENYTDRIISLANHITEALEKAFPGEGKAARFFAYQGYSHPPEKTMAEGNIQVEVTRGAPELIKKWSRYVKNLQRWDYNGWNTFKWGPMPLSILPEKVRMLKNSHYTGGYFDEGIASVLSLGGPFYYIDAKLMWDPDADVNELLNEFFKNYYGKASEPMRKCFDLLEKETRLSKTSSDIFADYRGIRFEPYIYSPDIWKKCIEWAKEAETLVADDPVRLRHVKTAMMTYLFSDVARDAVIAKQYINEKDHPFWKYIKNRREINTEELLEAIKLAKELGFIKVRGNAEPNNLEAMIAAWGYPLQIDIKPFQKIFYPEDPNAKRSVKNTGKWTLAFKDDFQRKDLGPDWKIIKGNWTIKDGCLTGRGDGIYINKKFPGDQRLEFEAWVNKDQSPCDLDGILSDASMSRYGGNGYLFAFGTYGNNYSKINRAKMQILKIPRPLIERGKKHRVICEKVGGHLKWLVDGKLAGEYDEPFKSLNGEYVGFYIDTAGQIDNVKVYTKE